MFVCLMTDTVSGSYDLMALYKFVYYYNNNNYYYYTPGSIDPRGLKLEAKNKYLWWLEVPVFVGEAEGVHSQSRVEALYER